MSDPDEVQRAKSERHRAEDRRSQRVALIGLAICLLLVLAGVLLVHELRKMSNVQDCIMQGRSNCAPLDGTR
jgi:hypothetical protein